MGFFRRIGDSGWARALRRRRTTAAPAEARAARPRFRPRLLTLVVFILAAAVITLANLSFDESGFGSEDDVPYRSYGWPLIWHRIVLYGSWFMGKQRVIGWYYSLPRLAANLVVWLSLLAALAGGCEWLLRRYRPRPRWSLRGLLAFVALVAVLCGWYAHARNRAAIQDPLIALRGSYGVPLVSVDRWGPRWLDLLGMDRLRRRLVLASGWSLNSHAPAAEQQFLQLVSAPDLRHLIDFEVDELTPTTAKALARMRQLQTLDIRLERRLTPDLPAALSELRQLRSLSIAWGTYSRGPKTADDNHARLVDECLAAIGNMTHLETLHLRNLPLHGRGLACLAGLKALKSLHVDFEKFEWKGSRLEEPVAEDSLRAIATLTQLEWLSLEDLSVRNESLACLVGLAGVKTLVFSRLDTSDRPVLSHLPPLPRLEAFGFEGSDILDDDLRRLTMLPLLKSLSLGGSPSPHRHALFSPGALAALGSLDSLEEVRLARDIKSPDEIAAFGAVKHLKRLHLNDTKYLADDEGELLLDDGEELYVDDLEGFRRALAALRQSKPGLVIDTEGMPIFWKNGGDVGAPYFNVDAFPERPAAWLPGGDLMWLTPQELADFEQAGGRASFDRATLPDEDKGKRGML